jgi:hypothetical protein
VLILFEVVRRGIGAMGWEFLTQIQPPARREGGGYLNGIVGTFYMVGIATRCSRSRSGILPRSTSSSTGGAGSPASSGSSPTS